MGRPFGAMVVTALSCALWWATSAQAQSAPTPSPAPPAAPSGAEAQDAGEGSTPADDSTAAPEAAPATEAAADAATEAEADAATEPAAEADAATGAAQGTDADAAAGTAAGADPQTAPLPAEAAAPAVEQAPPPVGVDDVPAWTPPDDLPARRAPGPKLYVRLAVGMGFPFGFDVADRYAALDPDRARFSGLAFATDVMVGTPLADWIAVGGGAVSDAVTSGEIEERDGNTLRLERNLYMAVLGPFVDIYPSAPAGFHIQALVGLAHLSRARNLGDDEAVGPGAALAVGYEWRASSRWNVGILGRMTVAPLSMDPVDGVSRSPAFYQPSILLSATMQP